RAAVSTVAAHTAASAAHNNAVPHNTQGFFGAAQFILELKIDKRLRGGSMEQRAIKQRRIERRLAGKRQPRMAQELQTPGSILDDLHDDDRRTQHCDAAQRL